MATFKAPAEDLKTGGNDVLQVVSADVINKTTMLNGFIFPLALDPASSQRMVVRASDVSVKIMGITVSTLSFDKTVYCHSTQYADLPVDSSECSGHGGFVNALSIACSESNTTL